MHLTVMKRIKPYIPGLGASRGNAIASTFAICFYLSVLILLARTGRLSALLAGGAGEGVIDGAVIVITLLLLYAGAVLLPRISRTYEMRGSRFAKRFSTNRTSIAGLMLILAILTVTAFGPVITPYEPSAQGATVLEQYQGPSPHHPMGTDKFGRDICSRVLYGARISLSIGLFAVLIAGCLGTIIGILAGASGGIVDDLLMRITDGLLAFPRILLVLLLVALFSNSLLLLVLVIGCTSWMGIARLVRAELLNLKEKEYVHAAVASGVSRMGVIWKHLLPNAIGPVIVAATLQIGSVILLESTLSFLGVGIQPPAPSWGSMVFEGRDALLAAWWVAAAPAAAIIVSVVAFNLLGDGLRDALDPRSGMA